MILYDKFEHESYLRTWGNIKKTYDKSIHESVSEYYKKYMTILSMRIEDI
jgi:hypothetical protein